MRGEILPAIPTVLAWAAVAYDLPALRRSRGEMTRRSFWLALLFLALALTVLLPMVSLVLDQRTHIPNLSRLVGNGLVLLAAWSVQAYLFRLNYPDARAGWRIHRGGSMLTGVLALMIALFASAPVHRESLDLGLTRFGGHDER